MRLLLCSVFMFAVVSMPVRADIIADPALVTKKLLASLEQQNFEDYSSCFHSMVSSPLFVSRDAMLFWGEEYEEALSNGFSGEFYFEPVIVSGLNLDLMNAHFIINGVVISEGLLLGLENNAWKILNTI